MFKFYDVLKSHQFTSTMAEALGFDWRYVMYEEFNVQVMYWMGGSLALVIWVRPTLIKRKKVVIPDATEAKTVT